MIAALKAIAEPRRQQIIRLVWSQERAAGEVASHFEVSRPAISKHLRILKEAGLVEERRNGTQRLYRARVESILEMRRFLESFWDDGLLAIKLAAEASTKAPEAFSKPNLDFHPLVAALKADMADRRMSFGPTLGAGTQQPTTGPAPSVGVQKTSVLDQLTPNRRASAVGPRPGQMGAPFPQQPLHDLRPQPPTGLREQPGSLLVQRSPPVLRPQEPAGSSVLQPSQTPTPLIPTNVTTVITGIMPAQKKKDPAETTEEKPASQ